MMNKLPRELSEFFTALSDETRLKILAVIADNPLNVNEISRRIPEKSLQTISYQLGLLSKVRLVDYEKRGREKIFKIADMHVAHILCDSIVHLKGDTPCHSKNNPNDFSLIKEVLMP